MNVATLLDHISYFADDHLSDNIDVTPEGYLIARNAVIGRTGFQTYKYSEIADPEGLLEKAGEQHTPDEKIDLWRDAKEVFSPATMASFEGKTFTFTHPDQLLDPDSEKYHHAGHVQNVRRGEPLDTGDIPLIADIIVTDRGAIDAIKSGERELSCGYTYKLAQNGNRWDQTEILGNHVALVQHGRAGSEARIYDAQPEPETKQGKYPAPKFGPGHQAAMRVPKGGSSCKNCRWLGDDAKTCNERNYIEWHSQVTNKPNDSSLDYAADEFCSDWYEPKPDALSDTANDGWGGRAMNVLQRIKGLGWQAFAKEAKPEDVAAALEDPELRAVAKDEKPEEKPVAINGNGNGKLRKIGVLRDGTPVFDNGSVYSEGPQPGMAAKPPGTSTMPLESKGNDDDQSEEISGERAAMDRRKRMHDILDEVLSQSETARKTQQSERDADVGELKKLMSEYLGEEANEPEHGGDQLPAHLEKHKFGSKDDDDDDDRRKGKDDDDDDDRKKGRDDDDDDDRKRGRDDDDDDDRKGKDDAEIVRPEPELEPGQVPANPVGASDRVVFDAAATMTLLKAFRPIVASSKDKRVRAAFDTLYQGLRRAAKKGSTGHDSYARVIQAAGKPDESRTGPAPIQARDSKPREPKESPLQKQVRENDEMYANFMKKNHGLSATIIEKQRNKQ